MTADDERARHQELGRWADEWAAKHEATTPFRPEDHPDDPDYNLYYTFLEADSDAFDEFMMKADQIMGIDTETGLPIDQAGATEPSVRTAASLARTRDEAMLYLELHPCPRCGETEAHWDNTLANDDGWPARRYHAACPSCGTQREYLFRLPDRPLVPSPDTHVLFGGPEPSELLDAGEWLHVADVCARAAVPVGVDEYGRSRYDTEARESLEVAVAAMDEVLKFIPEDADEAPLSAFWTEAGQQVRAREPGRFERDRLLIVRSTYRNALSATT
jgi:hypothetical protein